MTKAFYCLLLPAALLLSCKNEPKTIETPWGTTLSTDGDGNVVDNEEDGGQSRDGRGTHFSLKDIQQSGEMIMLTVSGPETYYDYHGRGMGAHYLLCEKLAEYLGVTVRVDVCRDTVDMLQRLKNGEGDIIAVPMAAKHRKGCLVCGDSWLVSNRNGELAAEIKKWHKPGMLAEMKKQEEYQLTVGSITRRINPLMLSASSGKISQWDYLFRKYAQTAGLDWVMMAAQCYQESCFDPQAKSWAGACGLMQIMPKTADHLKLPRSQMFEPEPNVAASARLMRELLDMYSKEIRDPMERMKFALASYNAGPYHIQDAMALARKYGGNAQRWDNVKKYVLALSQEKFYRDPVVKYGYMRGTETAGYVDLIMQRWMQYRKALATGTEVVSTVKAKPVESVSMPMSSTGGVPHRAAKKNKWRKEP